MDTVSSAPSNIDEYRGKMTKRLSYARRQFVENIPTENLHEYYNRIYLEVFCKIIFECSVLLRSPESEKRKQVDTILSDGIPSKGIDKVVLLNFNEADYVRLTSTSIYDDEALFFQELIESIDLFPISHLDDHLETMEEIDRALKKVEDFLQKHSV